MQTVDVRKKFCTKKVKQIDPERKSRLKFF